MQLTKRFFHTVVETTDEKAIKAGIKITVNNNKIRCVKEDLR
jgi:hypothetical protein